MKIAVDPGHGMSNRTANVFDSGATHVEGGLRFREADIALKYGLTLHDVLRARRHEVFMTRDDNTDHAPVGSRASNARRAGCDVFVSLHLNDFDSDDANGLEVLFRDEPDRGLAEAIQSALIRTTGFRNRGIQQRNNLAVLRFDGPAVLIELGFIANDGNRNALLNPQMREEVCETIADILAREEPDVRSFERGSANARQLGDGYNLPAYAREILGPDSGVPWTSAQRVAGMNVYEGIVRNSCHFFAQQNAVIYEAKFAIDGDGSGGNDEEDPTHQAETSLHDANDRPLNSRRFPFIVLPLPPRDETTARLQQFGLKLGDLGICFYKSGARVAVLYGDHGPRRRIGEGSMLAAHELGINPDPNIGGIDASEIPPGIMHVAFPGTARLNQHGTLHSPNQIEEEANALFDGFKGGGSRGKRRRGS